ncbi:MAG: hypothetical protein P4L40_00895 [Terracidiphilus sp.]|nr:hypothetical protein [Terracidiphilus sp.]
MRIQRWALTLAALAVAAGSCGKLDAQQTFMERFRAHNAETAKVQPPMVTPLVATDPRLIQYVRLAFSHQYTASGTETTSYGNSRGAGITVANRFEFDWLFPPYIQHNSTAADGFGDTALVAKYRIASGDAKHGNYEIAALLNHCFATGSHKNGALTDSFTPTVAVVKDVRQFAFISSLGGVMPTGKIAAQGRTINWHEVAQMHATSQMWLELENNASFYFSGTHDGRMQNFVTPGAFYVLRKKHWGPAHSYAVFAGGMQIATSGFHAYNHNLISEVRVLF